MKIVILSDDFPPNSFGGADIIASNLAHALSNRGHEVFVITTTKVKEDVGKIKNKGFSIYRIYSNYHTRWKAYNCLYNPKVLKEIEEIIKSINPDVVHAHNVHGHLSYASLAIARKYSKAVFLTAHDVMSVHYGKLGSFVDKNNRVVTDSISPWKQFSQYKLRYNPFRNLIIKYYFKKIDKIFAVSNALKNVLERRGILNVEVLHNGIKVSDWGIDENKLIDFRKKHNIQNKKVMFFGGRLSEAKGAGIAIKVLAEVSKSVNDIVLLVVGDKSKLGNIITEIDKHNLSDRVIFTGWIEHSEMRYAYAVSDIVLVLSRYLDPFPTVNLESMAVRKPVVGTIFGGTPEAVLDSKTGYIVDPNNIEMVTKKVIDLLINEEKLKLFGLAGYERVSTIFNEDNWIDKTIAWYNKFLHK